MDADPAVKMINTLKNVSIRGITTVVPATISRVEDYSHMLPSEAKKFSQITGIIERRIVNSNQTSADLCYAAAEDILKTLDWRKEDIEVLILITQSGDYPIPATAIVLQDRLGLKRNTLAFDINLGCSSYPYGIAIIGSLLKSLNLSKGLLLIGDTSSKLCSINDKSTWPLFGDAGSATAIEISEEVDSTVFFDFNTDGSGKDAIIINSGGLGSRNPATKDNMHEQNIADGITKTAQHLQLKGADVFSFAIKEVPKSIGNCLSHAKISINEIDFIILHQANKMINDNIIRKIYASIEKVLHSLEKSGNTSSVSIPLTICFNKDKFDGNKKLLLSGFGIGLSWATCILDIDNIKLNLLEI